MESSAAATAEWQARIKQAWDSAWPGNDLESALLTEAHAVDFDAAGTAEADGLLRQIEGREQELIASLGAGADEESLSPYAKDKLAAAKARYELAHRLRKALEDATMALSLDAPQSGGPLKTPGQRANY